MSRSPCDCIVCFTGLRTRATPGAPFRFVGEQKRNAVLSRKKTIAAPNDLQGPPSGNPVASVNKLPPKRQEPKKPAFCCPPTRTLTTILLAFQTPPRTLWSPPTRRSTWAPKRAVTKSSRRSTTESRAPSHTPARKSSRRSTPDRPAAKSKRRPTPERPAPSSTPAQPAQTSAVAPASKPSQRSTPERPARISSERSSPVLPVARKSSERSPADKHRRKTVISPQIVHDPPSPGPQTPLPSSAQRSRRQPTPRAEPPARSPRFQIAPGHQVNDQMTRIEEISAQLRVTPFKPFCACLT